MSRWAIVDKGRTALAGYAVGGVLALAALGIEHLAGFRPTREALAAYALVLGTIAAASRIGLAFLGLDSARLGALLVLLFIVDLHLLYFLNARLLASEHYLSFKSLGFDLLVVALSLVVFIRAIRWGFVRKARARIGMIGPFSGAFILAAAVTTLIVGWPRSVADPIRIAKGPNLVVIVLDSVRRDHLALYGYARPTSPALDAYRQKLRIYDGYAGSSWTVPSVNELFNVGVPGVTDWLPDRLRSHGYVTACFTDNPHLGRRSELMRGFDRVEQGITEWRDIVRSTAASEILDRLIPRSDRALIDKAVTWANGHTEGPFFLYIHLMDSHTPYRFPPIDGKQRHGKRIEFPHTGMRLTFEEHADLVARYDAGIRSAEAQAGRLLAALFEQQRPFLAIVTADHGESLGEEGRYFHGKTLAPELLAVPLVVLGQGVFPGRVSRLAGWRSLAGTLLVAAGMKLDDRLASDLRTGDDNRSIEGELPPDMTYLVSDGFKLTVNRRAARYRLFDIVNDPQEMRDVAEKMPERVRLMASDLHAPRPEPMSAEQRERLRALGYIGN